MKTSMYCCAWRLAALFRSMNSTTVRLVYWRTCPAATGRTTLAASL
jgi:hypothetical protein